jgi:hypothetical protein
MKIAHFVSIGEQTWPPHAILVSDWSISLKLISHMNRNLVRSIYEMSNLHLAKQIQRRRFKKISQSETRIACGGHVC